MSTAAAAYISLSLFQPESFMSSSADSSELDRRKKNLRGESALTRHAIAQKDGRSAAIALPKIFAAAFSDTDLSGKTVSAYWPMQDEIDPRPLMRALRGNDVPVCLPFVAEKDKPMSFKLWDGNPPPSFGLFGEPKPCEKAEQCLPDIVLMPLLAFDRQGGRLGYGGGCYDRTVAAFKKEKPEIFCCGLAFAGQEVDLVPMGETDLYLDAVATEKELIRIK